MATHRIYLVLFFVISSFTTACLAKVCTYKNLYRTVSIDCDNGCCAQTIDLNNYKKEEVCCPPLSSSTMAAIIGGNIGGIVGFILLIVACSFCLIKISKRKQNAARASNPNQSFFVIMSAEGTSSQPAVTTNPTYLPPPSYEQVMLGGTTTANPYVNPAYDVNPRPIPDADGNAVNAAFNKNVSPAYDNTVKK